MTNQIEFIKGKGDLPFIQIDNDKASALISIYGGQILSFKPSSESTDLMFNSQNAYYQKGKAIKGGIPICWPWFGSAATSELSETSKKPDHGFVRNNFWSVTSLTNLTSGETKVILDFKQTELTRALWPYPFQLSLEIVIGDSLSLTLITQNVGNQSFFITEALHAYFHVGDTAQVQILGLEHTEYSDKNENYLQACQTRAINITEETDHIYTDVKHELIIDDPTLNRKIKITSSGNNSAVIWNPWIDRSAKIGDLDDHDYSHFICLEISNATDKDRVEIAPHQVHKLCTTYSILPTT